MIQERNFGLRQCLIAAEFCRVAFIPSHRLHQRDLRPEHLKQLTFEAQYRSECRFSRMTINED